MERMIISINYKFKLRHCMNKSFKKINLIILIGMISLIIINIVIFLNYNLNSRKTEDGTEFLVMYNDNHIQDSLKIEISKNNMEAFRYMQQIYFLSCRDREFIVPAFFVSHDKKNLEALKIYVDLINPLRDDTTKIGNPRFYLYTYYLIKLYELGESDVNINLQIENLFGKGNNIPSSKYYLEKYDECIGTFK